MRKQLTFFVVIAACGGAAKPGPATPPSPPAPAAKVDAEVERLVAFAKDGPAKDKYPDADAVVDLAQDDITLKPDGTVVARSRSIVRLLDAQRGKEKYADVHIPYDPKRQTLTIQVARTINGDGTVTAASAEEITDIVPPWLADATTYSTVRERVISFPAVSVGSVIELDFTRSTKDTGDASLGGELALAAGDPILRRKVTITVPKDKTPHLAVEHSELAPVESSDGTTRTYTYSAENVPLRRVEILSLPDAALLPRVVFAFLPDWATARARVEASYRVAPSETVKAEAARITAGAKTETERARAIYSYVTHEIRSIAMPLGSAGYATGAPDAVLKSKVGDERDKVALLVALCAAQGIKGEAVLVRSRAVPVLESVPTVAQFDRLIARLTVDGKDVWLDPIDEHGQFGVALPGQDGLALALGGEAQKPLTRPRLDKAASVSQINADYTLSAKGDLEAKLRFVTTGYYAVQAQRTLRALKGENLTRFFQTTASSLSASALAKGHKVGDLMSVSGPLEITHDVSVPRYAAPQGRFQVFHLPEPTLDFVSDAPSASLSKRKDPLWLGTPRTIEWHTTLKLPAGWKVAYVPPELKDADEGVAYETKCQVKKQIVSCDGQLRLDALTVGPEKYEGFRRAMVRLDDFGQRVVLLTR